MWELLFSKFKEAFKSVFPITLIITIISFLVNDSSLLNMLPTFYIGSLFLIIGMCLFDIGADSSMVEMGEAIGKHLTSKKSIPFLLFVCFIVGFIVTVAEPDLIVLASQAPAINTNVLIYTVGIGVGLFLLLAVLRMLYKINFAFVMCALCILMFGISFFVPSEFVPVAFDSGGVTTGALTVPLLVALGSGITRSKRQKNKDDSFGMMSFCSIGPIIIVLILGLIYNSGSSYEKIVLSTNNNILSVLKDFVFAFPSYLKEVLFSLLPILLLFFMYNSFYLKLKKKKLKNIIKGLLYTYFGLSIFLTGVNVGFLPVGYLFGKVLGEFSYLLIPVGILVGYFTVYSEPAVSVLTDQIEDITDGTIKKSIIRFALALGVSIATGLSMARCIYGINLYYLLIPGYLIAIILCPFVPQVFTAIAFDSGGVASGTMTATFLLPFAMGACEVLGRNVLIDAFGLIAIVATIPLITVQLIGLIYKIKSKVNYNDPLYNEEIIDY